MAITVDVGKIKLQWRGTYDGGTAYEIDDVILFDDSVTNSAYIAVANSTGQNPSSSGTVNSTYWNLLAQGASATSSGTADGQIQYKSATGFAATSLLFYDTTNNYLGISSEIPTRTLDVLGTFQSTNLNITGIATFIDANVDDKLSFDTILETTTITAGATNATTDLDVKNGSTFLFTTNSGATWTHNLRGDASTTLDSIMDVGQSLVVTVISKQNNVSYYTANITIDGSGQTEYWTAGSAPAAGMSSSGYDVYSWTIIKTGSAAFTVLATQSQFG